MGDLQVREWRQEWWQAELEERRVGAEGRLLARQRGW